MHYNFIDENLSVICISSLTHLQVAVLGVWGGHWHGLTTWVEVQQAAWPDQGPGVDVESQEEAKSVESFVKQVNYHPKEIFDRVVALRISTLTLGGLSQTNSHKEEKWEERLEKFNGSHTGPWMPVEKERLDSAPSAWCLCRKLRWSISHTSVKWIDEMY